MEVTFIVWKAEDIHGNVDCGMVGDSGDTIQVCGLMNTHGEDVYFEGDFSRL